MEDLQKRLINKSIEAFIMGIEIYNKPTIKYRIEGFSFFICNAWELLLKAQIVKQNGEQAVYFSDNEDRTISLEDALKLIFTNEKDPFRINMRRIIQLRNTSTHFITEDYETIYAPLFQSNIVQFINKMEEFHKIDITEYVAQNFLTLSVRPQTLNTQEIRGKYSPAMAEKLIQTQTSISEDIKDLGSTFAIPIKTTLVMIKNPKKADLLVSVVDGTSNQIKIVKKLTDPDSIFIYSPSKLVKTVNKKLAASKTLLKKFRQGEPVFTSFTMHDFQLFKKFYDMTNDEKLSHKFKLGGNYGYSQNALNLIVEEIKKDPENIIQNLKKHQKK